MAGAMSAKRPMATAKPIHVTTHEATLAGSAEHYNAVYRHRLGLAAVGPKALAALTRELTADSFKEAVSRSLEDPGCAAIARFVVKRTPRYAAGILLDGQLWPDSGGHERWHESAAAKAPVVLVNPIGGSDNAGMIVRGIRAAAALERWRVVAGFVAVEDFPEAWRHEKGKDRAGEWTAYPIHVNVVRVREVAYVLDVAENTIRKWIRPALAGRDRIAGRPKKPPR